MPKLKPGTVIPTAQEDAAIAKGIAADPDTYELNRVQAITAVRAPESGSDKGADNDSAFARGVSGVS
jgi:hypothetical protein